MRKHQYESLYKMIANYGDMTSQSQHIHKRSFNSNYPQVGFKYDICI